MRDLSSILMIYFFRKKTNNMQKITITYFIDYKKKQNKKNKDNAIKTGALQIEIYLKYET